MRRPTSGCRDHAPISTFIGWSGLAAAFSGVLFAILGYVDREGAPWFLDLGVILLGIVVPLLFIVTLAGVYAKCRTQTSWLGVIGFVVGFAGAGWGFVAGVIIAPTIYGQLGERSWDHCIAQECGLSLLLSAPLTWLLVGLTVVGLSAIRKGTLRDWGHLLLTLALCGWVYQLTDDKTGIVDVRSVHVVFGILFSLGWIVLGYALWSSRNMVRRTTTGSLKAL